MDRYPVISLYVPKEDTFDYHMSQNEAQLRAGYPLIIAREDGLSIFAYWRPDSYYYEAQDLIELGHELLRRSTHNTSKE